MSSRISGIGVIGIEKKIKEFMQSLPMYLLCLLEVFTGIEKVERPSISRKTNPFITKRCSGGSYEKYKKYSAEFIISPINLRDLLEFKNDQKSIKISEVEPIEEILKRFGSGASHGA